VKDDLMTRLGNAIKQRDAAREEALLAAEKLNKLQEDLDNGVLQAAPQGMPSSLPQQALTPPSLGGASEPGVPDLTPCTAAGSWSLACRGRLYWGMAVHCHARQQMLRCR
jgi:hypothetical protein